jgi:carbamoyltransferase
MWILGIAASHNSGAALIEDGRVVVAVQTERLLRRKRQPLSLDPMGPHAVEVISYCLRYAGIDLPDLAAIATCTPWEAVPPRFAFPGVPSPSPSSLPRFVTVPHHLAHAEYALHFCPLERSLVVVCDGAGTYEAQRAQLDIQELEDDAVKHLRDGGKESVSAYAFDGATLKLIHRIAYGEEPGAASTHGGGAPPPRWMASLGHLWEWCALYCHGDRHEAGKVMGLAPFGDPEVHASLDTLSIGGRGEMRLDLRALVERFRSPNVSGADVGGDAHYADIAAHVQQATNAFLVELVRFLQGRHPGDAVCYSGGVALNGVANEHLRKRLGLDLHMNGSCEDNGTAIGAALAAYHAFTGRRVREEVADCYGREYSAREIQDALRGCGAEVLKLPRPELLRRSASALASGSVVGWFQGRSEFGPRALGNRSILADPRNPGMQDLLNRRVKHREAFRPYAPAVMEARASEFFDLDGPSPVMLRVVPVRGKSLPAITHVDGTARVQTVNGRQNPLFHELLKAFDAVTGVPVLLNTSFNIAGEPIVETPADALRTFVAANLDVLVLGDFLVHPRRERPGASAF